MNLDALPSNAGDRYHFVYAARRMLDMLHPRNNLVLIEMENVAKEDIHLATGPETFLGVDLTEYYSGLKSDTAERIVVVQVKYSPTHQTERWTLSRLCANKASSTGKTKPGSSVLRKLANAFNAFYSKLGDATPDKFEIRLHTNQRLDGQLQEYFEQAKALIESQKNAKLLQQSSGDLRVILEELLSTTRLSWKRLAAFIKCWNLSSFGQAMLSEAEGELFTVANQYRSDSDLYIDRLISFIQDHASSNRPTEITREKVYAQLRLREEDFFPAPQRFEPIGGLLFTEAAQRVIKEIDQLESGFLLVHGVAGTGKSTTLRLVGQHYGEGRATVIYDCYAGGAGLQLGSERFPADKCFVQVINELDSLAHTNILATTRLNTYNLISQSNQALERAAQLAAQSGHRLIVAFDAVDNAVAAASRSPLKGEHSFVPMLWRIRCPQNCVIIVSARTENLGWLNITCDYRDASIGGFSEPETAQYVRSFWQNASDTLINHIHERTKGNPRVQSKLIEAATREPSTDLFKLVNEKAKETAFEYYLEACPDRLASDDDRLILGVVLEAAPPLTLPLLADILGQPIEKVRVIVDSLYFGLRLDEDERVSWADQDFFDFSTEFASSTVKRARQLLGQYCRQEYETSKYARVNLSRHLFLAGGHDDLVNWWLKDDRLVKRIAETTPHEEDVLTDVQYSLLAAINLGRLDEALRLLAIAADIKQGRDLFSTEVKSHLDAAIECGYLERLLESLREDNEQNLPSCYFRLARSLITHGGKAEFAVDLIRRGSAIIEQERAASRRPDGGFSLADVLNIEVAYAGIEGFASTLKHLERWTPQETVLTVYGSLTRVCSKGRGDEILTALNSVTLTSQKRAYALIGLLSAIDASLSQDSLRLVADEVQKFGEDGSLDWEQATQFLPAAILNLLSRGLRDEPKKLLPRWQVRPPYYQHDPNIFAFTKLVSLRTALGIEAFDPDTFQVERPGGSTKQSKKVSNEDDYMQRQLRDEIRKLFPGTLCWARAIAGVAEDEEVVKAVEDVLRQWEVDVNRWWYEPQFPFIDVAALLLEAITGLRTYQKETVTEILDLADRVLRGTNRHGYERYAEALSRDSRYHAQAEELIQKRRAEVRPPAYRASEAVQALLDLYPVAASLDRDLASDVFTDARLAASEWDGNIGGRAFALLRTASHAQTEIPIDSDHLTKIATVFEYMKQVAFDDTYSGLEEALRLIARVQPAFAFTVLTKLEQSSLLDFDDGIGPIGLGMLDAGHVPAQAIWGLGHSIVLSEKVREVFYEVIPQLMAKGEPVDSVLNAFARHLRTGVPRELRAVRADEFVTKAQREWGLGTHTVTRKMDNFASELGELSLARAESPSVTQTHSVDLPSPLSIAFLNESGRSPQEALRVLSQANNDDIRKMVK